MEEHCLSYPLSSELWFYKNIFNIESLPSYKSGEVVEKYRKSRRFPLEFGEENLGIGSFPEHGLHQRFFSGFDQMGEFFKFSNAFDKFKNKGNIFFLCKTDI
ncbi:hypothetical protein MSWHS_1231 [Methanosarcina sp. WWM596]|nr:hypothetical protein MSWHS_1231 [Methanosarcina sp. WWM596]AKB21427.1 hypothetical protein MSWH1_1156 [Methanosarcina sp. WH1]